MITFDQEKYIDEIVEKFNFKNANTKDAPLPIKVDENSANLNQSYDNKDRYQMAVGKLMYLSTCSSPDNPDIAYALSVVSQSNKEPKVKDWNNVPHIVRYLKGTKDLKLSYQREFDSLEIYCDADYNKVEKERLSRTGFVVKLAGGAVAWYSEQQTVTSLSTAAAEYYAMCEVIKEVLWFRMMCMELNLNFFGIWSY